MSKVNTLAIRRPKRPVVTVTLSDPQNNPGLEIPLVFRPMDNVTMLSHMDSADEYIARYVTGVGDPESKAFKAPETLAPVDDEPVFITPMACRIITALSEQQVADESDRYSWEEFARMMSNDVFAAQLMQAFNQIGPRSLEEGERDPNPASGPTRPSLPGTSGS